MRTWHLRPRGRRRPSVRRRGHRRERRQRSGHVNDPLRQGGKVRLVATSLVARCPPLCLTALPRRRRRVLSAVPVSDGAVVTAVVLVAVLLRQGRQAPPAMGCRRGLGLLASLLAGPPHRWHWIHGYHPRGKTLRLLLHTVPNRGGGAWPCRLIHLWQSRASSQTRGRGPGDLCLALRGASAAGRRARKGRRGPLQSLAGVLKGRQARVRRQPRLQGRARRQGRGGAPLQVSRARPTGRQ